MVINMGLPCSKVVGMWSDGISMTGWMASSGVDAMTDSFILSTRVVTMGDCRLADTNIEVSVRKASPQPHRNRKSTQRTPQCHLLQVEFQVW